MKKIVVYIFLIMLCVPTITIYADDFEGESYYGATTTQELYERYMTQHSASGREDLSSEENNELSLLIEQFKVEILDLEPARNARAHWSDFTGAIFVHYDDTETSGWNHGHAAIGRGTGCVEIKNKNQYVTAYGADRVAEWYSKESGGLYTVRNAYATHNSQAAQSAYSKVGSGYYVIGPSGSWTGYTCSGLVATSWNDAGLGTVFLAGRLAVPVDFENSSNTVLQFLWSDVDY